MRADKKQQEMLKQFFKEETTWFPEHVGYILCACLLIGISMIGLIIPAQEWRSGKIILAFNFYFLQWMGLTFYVQKFTRYTEERERTNRSIYKLLRYFPVSERQVRIFVMRKTAKLCAWLAGISIFFQSVFAVTLMHTFSVWNILLPLIYSFIAPLGVLTLGMFVFEGK